jgi:hypothetical protein
MRAWRTVGIVLLAILTAAVMALVAGFVSSRIQVSQEQAVLQPFYDVPSPLPGPPGTVIRTEPLGVSVPGATALRMLYVSERPDGTPAASGGMLFIPDSPAPPEGRPVVAWAHGTLGMGDACAPSRSTNPLADTDNWLDQMMELGWVVAATDYVGIGTPDSSLYLIAQSEVRDVVNAVRAARNVPETQAGARYATWGHSQGGHSSVWTGHLGEEYAPELELVGVAAAAPALELGDIMGAQWDTLAGWVIGPDVLESWPDYYPDLPVEEILSPAGQDADARLAAECVKASALEGLVRQTLGQDFFAVNPTSVPAWSAPSTRLPRRCRPRCPSSSPRALPTRWCCRGRTPSCRRSGARQGRRSRCSGWAASTTSPLPRRPGRRWWRGWTTDSRDDRPRVPVTPRHPWRLRCPRRRRRPDDYRRFERFARTRMTSRIGVPTKPNSSRRRRSMNRR